jgi:EAL domain-containing protein (putative c-di-GMP-specific phosphodiesterase class I)
MQQSQVMASCEYLLNQLQRLLSAHDKQLIAHAGIALSVPGLTPEAFLAQSDAALRQAQSQAPFTLSLYRHTPTVVDEVRSAQQWHDEISRILREDALLLSHQSCCLTTENTPIHHEVFLRARDDKNSVLSAGQLIPFAERFNLAIEMDKKIIKGILAHLEQTSDTSSEFVVNISQSSLCSTAFIEWLGKMLKSQKELAKRLTFELVDAHVARNLAAATILIQRTRVLGCHFALDHFGRDYSAFAYLPGLKIDYLKLDGSFTRNIHYNQDNQFYIRAVIQAAHTVGIKVYATHVENAQQWEMLTRLGIDGGQGQFLSPSLFWLSEGAQGRVL